MTTFVAGDALCELLSASGAASTAAALAVEITARAPAALWAWRRRAFDELGRGAAAAAAASFQAVLRGRPGDAGCWEGLGAAYEALGRLTAGLKVSRLQWLFRTFSLSLKIASL